MEYNRQRDIAIAESAKARLEGKVLKQLNPKTWVYCKPEQAANFKKRSFKDDEDTTEFKTRTLKVEINGKVYANVRLAADHLRLDFRYLYRRLNDLKIKKLDSWTFKNGETVKMKFV